MQPKTIFTPMGVVYEPKASESRIVDGVVIGIALSVSVYFIAMAVVHFFGL